jgi:hypothetical protein
MAPGEAEESCGPRGLATPYGVCRSSGAASARARTGSGLGEALGRGVTEACGEAAAKSLGADCATGAVGLVEPTTKWTVIMTAVTLAAVQDSQMST